ncbi:hypothetical protein VA7868_03251 [Vibrio aerogenes CECT 7868]|uniref:Lipoprotein n=1 Tax=Vibrio aerogenes CECT 7868 TaxID=1216006 RepID=A0A1M5ZV10_9VIBR|nr:hypothetical protein [Vibrio aerogenes]SHI27879.1 hypothetical protein VA7868_03251 [Vibrio aerogenes CECT 7868]
MRRYLLIFFGVFLSGCAAGPGYKYYVEPTPLKQNVTRYRLGDVKVVLTRTGYIKPDSRFASASELQQTFMADIRSGMQRAGILAGPEMTESPVVRVTVDYTRHINLGGVSLYKSKVSHYVVVSLGGKELAEFRTDTYSPQYPYLEEPGVNLKMAAFLWNEKDEPRDVALISGVIVKDLAKLGH